jgi:hypothetical protein
MAKKDRTPPEIKAARKAKERRRLVIGAGFFALWWVLFALSFIPGLGGLLLVSWLALSGQTIVIYGLHEKALRKIASRPEVDYNQLHKVVKAEARTRSAGISGEPRT